MLRELDAMQAIADIVADLTVPERVRVTAWLTAYADQGAANAPADIVAVDAPAEDDTASADEPADSEGFTFSSLYQAVAPRTNAQRAVVAAWWLEEQEGRESWFTHDISKQLGTIGVRVNALSIALANEAKAKAPKIELREKQGDSMQSRKSFVLTQAGKDYVAPAAS